MATALLAQTLDDIKVYKFSRDNAAPGSGTWTNAGLLFDGIADRYASLGRPGEELSGSPAALNGISAGALDQTESLGVLGDSPANLYYIGDGRPSTPQKMDLGGAGLDAGGGIAQRAATSQGAFNYGGRRFIVSFDPITGFITIYSYASPYTSRSWDTEDGANGSTLTYPDLADVALQRIDEYIFLFTRNGLSSTDWIIKPFNMSTRLYETDSTVVTLTGFSSFTDTNYKALPWSNGLLKFANGNFMVFWGSSSTPMATMLTGGLGGTWGADIALPGGSGQSMGVVIIDPSFTFAHVFTYDSNDYTGLVRYSTIDQTGTVTPNIATIPATVVDSNGLGHPSIMNGKIFVPRDDLGDFASTVWVATLPVSSFVAEQIPVPSQEQNSFTSANINTGGSGYSFGETFFVNGSAPGCPQMGRVFTTGGGGSVTGVVFPNFMGGGYSTGIKTVTPEGGNPALGTGLTFDLTAPFIRQKQPRYAYMLYPNGYVMTVTPSTGRYTFAYTGKGSPRYRKNLGARSRSVRAA